ncbi:MAG TPA: hypothetical protein VF755_25700 [Catenuloplanes sp.]|jgi:hypothetical protein
MSGTWRHLPAPARAMAVGVSRAVEAAQQHDRVAYAEAVGQLGAMDPAQVSLVLGATVRLLLEQRHPDGLAGEDVGAVLRRCVRGAAGWQPDVDPHLILVLLAGALGIHDPDAEGPPAGPGVLAGHAALVVADLLEGQDRRLADYLGAAFQEIERAERHD